MSQPDRDWYVQLALKSTRSLSDVLEELTEEDCLRALEIEAATRRRNSTMSRLIFKIADIRRHEVLANLKEKFKWHEANQ